MLSLRCQDLDGTVVEGVHAGSSIQTGGDVSSHGGCDMELAMVDPVTRAVHAHCAASHLQAHNHSFFGGIVCSSGVVNHALVSPFVQQHKYKERGEKKCRSGGCLSACGDPTTCITIRWCGARSQERIVRWTPPRGVSMTIAWARDSVESVGRVCNCTHIVLGILVILSWRNQCTTCCFWIAATERCSRFAWRVVGS